jgi:hypothetical protein
MCCGGPKSITKLAAVAHGAEGPEIEYLGEVESIIETALGHESGDQLLLAKSF